MKRKSKDKGRCKMKWSLKALVLLVLAGGLLLEVGVNQNSPAASGGVPSWLVSLVRQVAANNGDAHPTNAQAVLTTRQRAVTLDSASRVDSDQPTYYVVLRGQFADTHARTPDGRTIYGTVLTLTVDSATHRILDFGLSDRVPAVAQLGPVSDLADQL